MKDYLIIYHKEDNDGVVSCAILCDYLKKQGKTFDIWGANYRETLNLSNGECEIYGVHFDSLSLNYSNLVMTDISINSEIKMQSLYEMFGHEHFVWIDHHKANTTTSKPYGESVGVRDITHSALYNMYVFLYGFMGDCEVPWSLQLLSAYDSFTFKKWGIDFDECYNYNRGFTAKFNLNVKDVTDFIANGGLENGDIESISYIGKILNDNELRVGNSLIENAGETGWTVNSNRSAILVVYSHSSNSIMFKSAKNKFQNVIVIKRDNLGCWKCSLYNTDENDTFDCGSYLKKNYNGGGHIGAAGAEFSLKEFNKIMKNKNL